MSYPNETSTPTETSTSPSTDGGTEFAQMFILRDDPDDAVPWPEYTYMIRHRGTSQVVGSPQSIASLHGVHLRDEMLLRSDADREPYLWVCVESNGYFGFLNKSTRQYLSFRYEERLHTAPELGPKECFFARRHWDEAYQLLVPAGDNTLKQVAVVDGGYLAVKLDDGDFFNFMARE